jgi:nucleotide-binding universal stress UspA family protein
LIKKILVAVDGSEPSKNALNQALEHSVKWNAELIIISVIPPISSIVYMGQHEYIVQYKEAAIESQNKVLNEARTEIQKQHPDIKFETRLLEGRPSDIIVDTAREEDVDLIVMGSRGMGGIKGWVLGITSRSVVNSCTKPILIVK